MKKYSYMVIKGDSKSTAQGELNELGEQGWRVVACAGSGAHSFWWTLERISTDGELR